MGLVLEKDVEKYLKLRVEYFKGKCIKFVSPGEDGVPDRFVLLPGGKVAFVELKRPKGGRLSPIQKYQIAKLESLGCTVRVVKNYKEVDDLLKEMGCE